LVLFKTKKEITLVGPAASGIKPCPASSTYFISFYTAFSVFIESIITKMKSILLVLLIGLIAVQLVLAEGSEGLKVKYKNSAPGKPEKLLKRGENGGRPHMIIL
jgi:hypothetical protein